MEKCMHCDKKLRSIAFDNTYKDWTRKYHKKCYNDTEAYRNFLLKKKDEIDKMDYERKMGWLKSACLL